MSLPGRLLLKFNEYRALGPKAAWYRDIVRPRILRSPACTGLTDARAEIHVMTSAGDWLNLVWALKSFYAASKRKYKLCIHDDGTLPAEALAQLRHHFQPVRIIARAEADARMERDLAAFPRLLQFRRTNVLAPKVTDFVAYLESERMLLLDSDILFFSEPTEFLRRLEDPAYAVNTFNSDCDDAYVVTAEATLAHCGVVLKPLINSGLGVVHRASLRYDWMEEFLGISGILEGHFWRIEQQLFALCASKFGVELLPEEYTVDISPRGIGARPCRHYIGCIRSRMYGEGIRRLWRSAGFSPPDWNSLRAKARAPKVLFAPDWRAGNPYQQLLADALAKQGVEVVFAPQTQGLFRLTKAAKAAGPFDVMHLHWPEAYFPALHDKRDALRRLFFPIDLRLALGGKPLVCTAHNLYPHNGDSIALVRRATASAVRSAEAISAHSAGSVEAVVQEFQIAERKCHVIPHGDLAVVQGPCPGLTRAQAREKLGLGGEPLCLAFGAVDPYKGLDEMLDAWKKTGETNMHLAIVGGVRDSAYGDSLRARVAAMPNGASVRLHLQRVDDAALALWMTACDCMLFNYRTILTSGSACLARSWGVPIVLPARLSTVDLMEPCANVVRFADTPESMLAAVRQAAAVGHLPEAAAHYRTVTAWDEVARKTAEVYSSLTKNK